MPFSPAGPLTLGCENGHRVDVNKRGYVSLLPPRSRVVGDTAEMLAARARFFESGAYRPIADAVSRACVAAVPGPGARIAEIGCGTGYYLEAARDALRAEDVLAADLSPAAVRIAVQGIPDAAGVVLDVWQPLPLATASRDILLSVFAPRNLPEFARVLDVGGCLVAVVPTGNHLREARAAGLALDVPEGKAADLVRAAEPFFDEAARTDVEFGMALDGDGLALLLGMGPSAHHTLGSVGDRPDTPGQVTASVTVLTLRRRS